MRIFFLSFLLFGGFISWVQERYGASIPWTTYEAEKMKTNGTVMGPSYAPYRIETESSGQRCVKLNAKGQYIEFMSSTSANGIVIRFSLPDKKEGGGKQSTLGIYKNGNLNQHRTISSQYALLYGTYPFTNDPAAGKPRNFYDEIRIRNIPIAKGDVIRIQRDDSGSDDADYCIIDLVDLETIAPPIKAPLNSLSITDKRFLGSDTSDYTEAFRKCIAMAVLKGKIVWIPAGTFTITGDILLPANIRVQGAGMWYSTLQGKETLYADASRRVRLKGTGSNIHLSDFAIIGKLTYRNDSEPNDGIVGSYGTNSTISHLWIEHTKVGMWIENSKNLVIDGCRMRNTKADGINFCVGMANSTIQNCTTRNTGDDCFAIWPATFLKQEYSPGHNLIIHCTAQLPFLANGGAIYGGESNQIRNCSFIDISPGSAILLSTTFPTEDSSKNINNNFSGTIVIENCEIKNSGGFDHEWGWRAAVQICLDKRSIAGVEMNHLIIENSFSDGLSVITKSENGRVGVLSYATIGNIKVKTYGIGAREKHGLWIASGVHGSLTLTNSVVSGIKNESKDFVIHDRKDGKL